MKRFIIASSITLLFSLHAIAGGQVDSLRYLSSKFGQNWFITANGTVNWWQGSDKNTANGMNYLTLNGPSFGGSMSLGKWITHNIGLRLTYDVNQGKSFMNGYYPGKEYSFMFDATPTGDVNGYYQTHFMYHNLHGDVIISPVDMITGYYNPKRFYTPVLFAGMGLACVSEHIFVIPSVLNKEAANFEFSFNAGLINNFRLSNALDLNITCAWSIQEYHIDSWYNELLQNPRPKRGDNNYSAQLGLTWYLLRGRIYELPHNYEQEMKDMADRIKDLENMEVAPEYIHDTIIQFINTETETEGEIVSFPLSIFFNKDSYQLMSKRDLVNLREIANVALEKGWKIRLRGSCDSATATPAYNQRLSENRCLKIKLELMDMGVPEDQMILVPVGGVKELDPTEFDRRVLIELVKEVK
jgi:outer membrane protein OmpA-like peptidoglycan-associated protein